MKSIFYFITTTGFIGLMNMNHAFADIKSAATKYSSGLSDIALKVAVGGLALGAIYMAFGKAEGKQKISDGIFGVLVVCGAGIGIPWLQSVMR